MYSKLPNLVLGFHGCDISTYDEVLHHHRPLNPSDNDYDWLGPGIYFWEQNLERALQWAKDAAKRKNSRVKTPAVIGAVIDLGFCLNLMDSRNIEILQKQYELFSLQMSMIGAEMPENSNLKNDSDYLLRKLDCAVIKNLHVRRASKGEEAFDSVRGVFVEGAQIYKNSGFKNKTHIQLAIMNPNCIKGYFAPNEFNDGFSIP